MALSPQNLKLATVMSKQEDGKMHHGTTESDPAAFKLAEKFNLSSKIWSNCLVSVSFFMLRLKK